MKNFFNVSYPILPYYMLEIRLEFKGGIHVKNLKGLKVNNSKDTIYLRKKILRFNR